MVSGDELGLLLEGHCVGPGEWVVGAGSWQVRGLGALKSPNLES